MTASEWDAVDARRPRDHAGALALCRQAWQRLGDRSDPALRLRVFRGLAYALARVGEAEEAEQIAEAALARAREPGDPEDLLRTLRAAADVTRDRTMALGHIDEAVRRSTEAHGRDAPPTLLVRHSRAEILSTLGRHAEATAELRAIQRVHVSVYGDDTLAEAYMLATIGQGWLARGRPERAARALDSALATARGYLPTDFADLAQWRSARR